VFGWWLLWWEIWYIYVDFFCVIFSLGILLLDIVCLFIFHLFLSNGISLYLRMKIYKNTMLFEDFYCAIFYFYQYDSKFYVFETQVTAAGDLCAICQEKMHSPILLRCKHIFCEDCVSEWWVHNFIPHL
jgi:hypothetical protein